MHNDERPLTGLELAQIVDQASRRAVTETLISLGIDTADPIRTQADFQTLRELKDFLNDEELKADLQHLRRWRLSMTEVQSKGLLVSMGLLITGLLTLVVLGFRKWFEG